MIKKDGSNLVVIIGAMKSGTTSLFKLMSEHHKIVVTTRTETHFFNKHYEKGIEAYHQCWPETDNEDVYHLEATPAYSQAHIFDDIPKKLHEHFPKAKIIYILRDRVKRLESMYRQYINDTNDRQGINKHLPDEILKTSMYYYQIEKYLEYFNKNQIKIVKTNDLQQNPKETLDTVTDFIGVEEGHYKNLNHKSGDSRVTNTFVYQYFRRFSFLKYCAGFLPQNTKYRIIRSISKKDHISKGLWQLDNTHKIKVKQQLKQDVKSFEKVFGLDI